MASKLFQLILPILFCVFMSSNNHFAKAVPTNGYFKLSWCLQQCTAPGFFCARDISPPYKYFCTDGTTDQCNVRRFRDYYIQAEPIEWNYLPFGVNRVNDYSALINDTLVNGLNRVGSVYTKFVYKRYTDAYYTTEIPSPPSQGFVGPTLKGETGDVIRIHLRNLAPVAISMHPHGVLYDKANEGAFYLDGTTGVDKEDDAIPYGVTKTITWMLAEEFGPTDDDPNCLPYAYHGHKDPEAEVNAGLLGLLIFCKPGTLSDTGDRLDVDRELVLYVESMDEAESLLLADNLNKCQDPAQCQALLAANDPAFMESLKKDSVNGYMYANGPPFDVCAGERVVWYIFSLVAELHAVEIHGHTFELEHQRTTVIGIWSATFISAMTVSTTPGYWLISCRNAEHNRNGMNAYLSVTTCAGTVPAETLTGITRTYYLMAEPTGLWDYGPSGLNLHDGGNLDDPGTASEELFATGVNRIGGAYLKARFVEYSDALFTTPVTRSAEEEHLALLGPVIRAQVGDTINVILQNNCTFPVSLYLQGVSFDKTEDGLWEKADGAVANGKIVTPGGTLTYQYTVPVGVSPTDDDPSCLSHMYYSAIDTERDINTGLVGPMLICKLGGLDPQTGKQRYVDREMFLLFADMDENLSWLIDDNIAHFGVDPLDPGFEESNIMRSINGRSYGNLEGLNVCKGDRVAWHVLGAGGNEALHGVTFNGNNILVGGVNRDSHVLIPELTFDAVMTPDNVGNWSIHCHNSDHYEKGEKALYTVDACGAPVEPAYDTSPGAVTRTYFIAAVEDLWDYSPVTIHPLTGEDYSNPLSAQYNRVRKDGILLGSIYKKALYKQYTDNTFTTEIPRGAHLGVLGPMIHVAVGDIVKVVFFNNASRPYSIHPQGLRYAKDFEGHVYQDGEASTGDAVPPGQTYTYYWEVAESSGPTVSGPNCVGSIYHSAVDPVKDTFAGLIGCLAICRTGILNVDNTRLDYISREFPMLMMAFDENLSWYLQDNIDANAPGTDTTTDEFIESNKYDSINGYIYNNLPGLVMNTGETVAWYGMGMGVSEDMHTIHYHGQTYIHRTSHAHRADVLEVFPGTYETAEMFCTNPGVWVIHCHIGVHTKDGMVATYTVNGV